MRRPWATRSLRRFCSRIATATIRVEFYGEKGPFVTGKDLILAVIDRIGVGGATNAVLEFAGSGAQALSIDERLAVANMAVEAGGGTGMFSPANPPARLSPGGAPPPRAGP